MAVLGASLAGMLGRVARLRLGEIAVRILHEVRLGLLIAEAISLALNGRIEGAIRFDVLMQSEALRTYCRFAVCGGNAAAAEPSSKTSKTPTTAVVLKILGLIAPELVINALKHAFPISGAARALSLASAAAGKVWSLTPPEKVEKHSGRRNHSR